MASEQERGHVGGIASAFEKAASRDAPAEPSAVTSIASRFEAASKADKRSSGDGVSSKISSLAGAFDSGGSALPMRSTPVKSNASACVPRRAADETVEAKEDTTPSLVRRFSEATAVFAGDNSGGDGGDGGASDGGQGGEGGPSMFRAASSAFQERERREELERTGPTETKVSAFAQRFSDAASTEIADGASVRKLRSKLGSSVEEANVDDGDAREAGKVSSFAARFDRDDAAGPLPSDDKDDAERQQQFESAAAAFSERERGADGDAEPTQADRFREAARTFSSH